MDQKETQKAIKEVFPNQTKPNRLVLQIFAIFVLVVLVAYGVFAWKNTQVTTLNSKIAELQKQVNELKDSSATTEDPYAGWKSYTTKYEKLTFKYPADYTLKDESRDNDDISFPGMDVVKLTSPNGFVTSLQLGISGIGGVCVDAKVVQADPVTVADKSLYINYVDSGQGKIDRMILSQTAQDACIGGFDAKNVYADPAKKNLAVNLVSSKNENFSSTSIKVYKSNTDAQDAALIMQSFSY